MSVSLDQITTWLYKLQINHLHLKKEGHINFANGDSDSSQSFKIETAENDAIFKMHMNLLDQDGGVINCLNNPHLNKILPYILLSNYNTPLGTWEYDFKDGDIRFAIEIPLEDAKMTFKQFQRILKIMDEDGKKMFLNIESLMTTGKLRRKSFQDKQAEQIKKAETADKIAKLEALIAQLKIE